MAKIQMYLADSPFWKDEGEKEWSERNWRDPHTLSYRSKERAYWVCSQCGYEWESQIISRTQGRASCPSCRGVVLNSGFNDLKTVYPSIGEEWDNAENEVPASEVLARSSTRGNFKCSACGFEWNTTVYRRTVNGNGCPECGKRRQARKKCIAQPGRDLETCFPEIAAELDTSLSPLPANQIPYASNKAYPWICPEHGTYWSRVANRTIGRGTGCPVCSGRTIRIGVNDLAHTHEHLARQWDYEKNGSLTPEDVVAGSNKIVWWRCNDCGHEWRQRILDRSGNNLACPNCRRMHERIEMEDPLDETDFWKSEGQNLWSKENLRDPHTLSAGSHYEALWVCPTCGESWHQPVRRAVIGEGGCPTCRNWRLSRGRNDLETAFPDIAAEFSKGNNKVKASDIKFNDRGLYRFVCRECGNEWETNLNLRTVYGHGCPECAITRQAEKRSTAKTGVNDLKTMRPDLAAELDAEFSPCPAEKIPYCSSRRYPWICDKHGTYWTTPNNRINGHGCPKCGLERVIEIESAPIVGTNDLASQRPDIAAELDMNKSPKRADEICVSSSHKFPWVCAKHGTYWASAGARTLGGTGCPKCNKSHGEQDISAILDELGVDYSEQWWHPRCKAIRPLKYDFAIFLRAGTALMLASLAEYQGEQHSNAFDCWGGEEGLKKRQEYDQKKRDFAEDEGVPLLEVPCTKKGVKNIKPVVLDFLLNNGFEGVLAECEGEERSSAQETLSCG